MKRILLLVTLCYVLQVNAIAGENIINFRLAYKIEKPNTFIAYDVNDIKYFVEKKPVIQVSDISKATLMVGKEKPPLWAEQAIKSAGGEVISPQVKIEIIFNTNGKKKFAQVTANNIGKLLAVFINNELVMAPIIHEKIDSGVALIQGHFTESEGREIVDRINSNIVNQ